LKKKIPDFIGIADAKIFLEIKKLTESYPPSTFVFIIVVTDDRKLRTALFDYFNLKEKHHNIVFGGMSVLDYLRECSQNIPSRTQRTEFYNLLKQEYTVISHKLERAIAQTTGAFSGYKSNKVWKVHFMYDKPNIERQSYRYKVEKNGRLSRKNYPGVKFQELWSLIDDSGFNVLARDAKKMSEFIKLDQDYSLVRNNHYYNLSLITS